MNELSQRCSRRTFLRLSAAGLATLATTGFPSVRTSQRGIRSVIVLGIDAMDPTLLKQYMADGRMPNTRKLVEQGSFALMGTSDPPQSPTAWSNFISGTNPGGHGIYDFIARDPATLTPCFSGTRLDNPTRAVAIGKYRIPLSGRKLVNLRGGPTFWNNLEEHGVDCTLLRIPVNFPPVPSKAKTLSGLGTPDIHGRAVWSVTISTTGCSAEKRHPARFFINYGFLASEPAIFFLPIPPPSGLTPIGWGHRH